MYQEHFEEEELRSGKDGPAPTDGSDGKPMLVVRGLPERDAIARSSASMEPLRIAARAASEWEPAAAKRCAASCIWPSA